MEHKLTREEIDQILNDRASLVDVRSRGEPAGQVYPHAVVWDVEQMAQGRFPNIPKDRPVFIFDGINEQSAIALQLMLAEGFTEVHNIGTHNNLPAELQ
jgi:rhodanese-related sulfurtransferase